MGIYAVTGSASGMGRKAAEKLRDAGHTVIGVDIKQADIVADLSSVEGRRAAADGVLAASGARLDGAVLAAGLGPGQGPDRPRLIAQVNYLGVVDLLDAWRPALAAAERAKVVVFSSNSTTTTPAGSRAHRAGIPCARCGEGGSHHPIVRQERFGDALRRIQDRRQPLGSPRGGEKRVGGRRHPTECSGSGRDYDAASGGAAVNDEAGETRSFLPCPGRRFRRCRAAGRLGPLHAVGCCGLPLRERRIRRWRNGRVLPRQRLAEARAGVSSVVVLQTVQSRSGLYRVTSSAMRGKTTNDVATLCVSNVSRCRGEASGRVRRGGHVGVVRRVKEQSGGPLASPLTPGDPLGRHWASPNYLRAQQLRLSQRATPVQRLDHRLQRHRSLELRRASPRPGLPGAGSPHVSATAVSSTTH